MHARVPAAAAAGLLSGLDFRAPSSRPLRLLPRAGAHLTLPVAAAAALVPPAAESKELLTYCIKRVRGLGKVKLVDAAFIWTEPHRCVEGRGRCVCVAKLRMCVCSAVVKGG